MEEQAEEKQSSREKPWTVAGRRLPQSGILTAASRLKDPAVLKAGPQALHGRMRERGRDWFYFLHGVADLCLLASGYMAGNPGRLATGALGAGRNASWFVLKKVALRSRADIATSFAAAASNVPQLVTSATLPETVAVSLVVGAYAMRGGTRLGRGIIEARSSFDPSDENAGSGKFERVCTALRHRIKDSFNETSGSVLMKLPPLMLMGRAIMQAADGYLRKDFSAMAAGSTFLVAATGLMVFDNRNVAQGRPGDFKPPG